METKARRVCDLLSTSSRVSSPAVNRSAHLTSASGRGGAAGLGLGLADGGEGSEPEDKRRVVLQGLIMRAAGG